MRAWQKIVSCRHLADAYGAGTLETLPRGRHAFLILWTGESQDKAALARLLEIFHRKQRIIESWQSGFPHQRDETGNGRSENADGKGRQHESRPGVERAPAAVDRIVDHGAEPFGSEHERRGCDWSWRLADSQPRRGDAEQLGHSLARKGREGIEHL